MDWIYITWPSFHNPCPNSHNLKVLYIQCLQHQLQDQYDELSICELTDGQLQLLGWYLYCGDGNLLFIHGDPRKHILTLCVYMQPYIYFSFIYHDATHTFAYSYNYVYIYWLSLWAIELQFQFQSQTYLYVINQFMVYNIEFLCLPV